MTSIENIYLATQLNRDGDAHVHGLDVSYCVGWFEMARPFWLFRFRTRFFVAFFSCGGGKLDC